MIFFLFVTWPGLLILEFKSLMWGVTSTLTRPVDNVVLTTKGLQYRNIKLLDGTTVENKGKTKINCPGQVTNKNSKFKITNNYNNQ